VEIVSGDKQNSEDSKSESSSTGGSGTGTGTNGGTGTGTGTSSGTGSEHNYVNLDPGTVISNRYIVQMAIGHGNMGSVFRVYDQETSSDQIAIKILHSRFSSEKNLIRFTKEAELMHKISHGNVVKTFSVGRDGDLVYYTMEFLEGDSLADLITERRLESSSMTGLALQICKGLEAIHAADVIHRDLKPGNIFITSEQIAKIMDFGIARSEDSNLTAHGEMLGSAGYMAPEIWLGKKPGRSVDLYALGVIFYEMATGELPYMSKSAAALMRHHLDTQPTPPIEKNPEISAELNDLILRLLAKDPSHRPQSTTEVVARLQRGDYVINHESSSNENKLPRVTGEALDTSSILGSGSSATVGSEGKKGFPLLPVVGGILLAAPLLYFASQFLSGDKAEQQVAVNSVESVSARQAPVPVEAINSRESSVNIPVQNVETPETKVAPPEQEVQKIVVEDVETKPDPAQIAEQKVNALFEGLESRDALTRQASVTKIKDLQDEQAISLASSEILKRLQERGIAADSETINLAAALRIKDSIPLLGKIMNAENNNSEIATNALSVIGSREARALVSERNRVLQAQEEKRLRELALQEEKKLEAERALQKAQESKLLEAKQKAELAKQQEAKKKANLAKQQKLDSQKAEKARLKEQVRREEAAKAKKAAAAKKVTRKKPTSSNSNLSQTQKRDLARRAVQRANRTLWRKNYQRAIKDFKLAISIDPSYQEARTGLARARKGLGQNSQSISDLKEALRVNPNNPDNANIEKLLKEYQQSN